MSVLAAWLSLHQSAPYVVAAYLVLIAVVLIYVTIMAARLARNQRELAKLRDEFEAKQRLEEAEAEQRDSEPVG